MKIMKPLGVHFSLSLLLVLYKNLDHLTFEVMGLEKVSLLGGVILPILVASKTPSYIGYIELNSC